MELLRQAGDSAVWRARLAPSPGRDQIVISASGLQQLQQWLNEARQTPECRILLLEGSSGAFCEGMDLAWITSDTSTETADAMAQFSNTLRALATAPQALIVLVDGAVRAGGMGLAAAADILIATEDSQFGLPEVMLGLVPSMVLPLLQARIGSQKSQKWAMMGESLSAEQAFSIGFIDQLVSNDTELEKSAKRSIRQLLRMHPEAIASCKRFCGEIKAMPLTDALQHGAELTGDILKQPERLAGIRSFLEGEPLPWFARYRPTREPKS